MALKLVRGFIMPSALKYLMQSLHRKSALEYLVHGTSLVHREILEHYKEDPCFAEFEVYNRNSILETLVQGAYVREFHLWEKEAKEYFSDQFFNNGLSFSDIRCQFEKKKNESIVDVVVRQLTAFDVQSLADELVEIDSMRIQVNKAKHDPGVLLDHFVSIDQFWDKHAAIGRFWSKLVDEEDFCRSFSV
ncbi:MAG: hypothetical protein CMM78_02780 [Rhodospirillaceae bacterium]|uniref:hypothetical protein n=1 Tax=Hwanghaeella sp. 1Z406 TaxID=3402811 RepID=UPI000C381DC2|nr:hypothetical protein [Rhodospirillales bacterium]MAX47109.1 hypothetical protein [Rhodospirillaceae bacterium]